MIATGRDTVVTKGDDVEAADEERAALRVYDGDAWSDAYVFDVTDGRITTIHVVRNPEKPARLDRCSRADPASS
jgi:hypothetical protein